MYTRAHLLLCRELSHRLELLDGRCTRLLEVYGGAARLDDLTQKARVVRRPPRDQRHPRPARFRHVRHRLTEGHATCARLRGPRGKGGSWRRVGARPEEPRLDDRAERGRGRVAVEDLLGMVPAHPALGHTSADTDHIARGLGGDDAASPRRDARPRSRQQVGGMAGAEDREHVESVRCEGCRSWSPCCTKGLQLRNQPGDQIK
eukprot:scaffold47521_cov53-Phaeocystis_antarctica.AAC.1